MRGRLGVYSDKQSDGINTSLDGVLSQQARLYQAGGNRQQERMIKDKRRSLDRAVWHSYQGAEVRKTDVDGAESVRALINPNKLKQDYDDKILSVGYEYNFKCGDVFEWIGTNTKWLIYLQDLTELAYFRGDIRRCSYEIVWEEDGVQYRTYAAVRGPVETKINFIQKHNISIDTPNYSLNILLPKTDAALKYFMRYNKFYLQGSDICWRVEAIDSISTPGILEVVAVEYYANETEDDIKNGIVGGLLEKIEDSNTSVDIVGDTFIKVKKSYSYVFSGDNVSSWYVDPKYPVELKINAEDPKAVILTWSASYSGQFDLQYGDYKKTIVVESLF